MVGEPIDSMPKMIHLWSHEVMRVFHDRLINQEDCSWFCGLIKDVIGNVLGSKFENVLMPPPESKYEKVSNILPLRIAPKPPMYVDITVKKPIQECNMSFKSDELLKIFGGLSINIFIW